MQCLSSHGYATETGSLLCSNLWERLIHDRYKMEQFRLCHYIVGSPPAAPPTLSVLWLLLMLLAPVATAEEATFGGYFQDGRSQSGVHLRNQKLNSVSAPYDLFRARQQPEARKPFIFGIKGALAFAISFDRQRELSHKSQTRVYSGSSPIISSVTET